MILSMAVKFIMNEAIIITLTEQYLTVRKIKFVKTSKAAKKNEQTIEIVEQGGDDYLYMQKHGWEANAGCENLVNILLRGNPREVALLEEFLHLINSVEKSRL